MPEFVVSASQPFPIEVMVYEEDTWRVLGAGNHIREIREPLAELTHQATLQRPHTPGELVVRGTRWSAILHDFDRPVTWVAGAVDIALAEVGRQVAEAGTESLGIQALGHFHGPENQQAAVERITRYPWPTCLKKVWVSLKAR